MAPKLHLLLLPLLLQTANGIGLEMKKVPFENMDLAVPEGTLVPHIICQFQVTQEDVTGFRLGGDGLDAIMISSDGWLYLDKPLDWSQQENFAITVEAMSQDNTVVAGPVHITITVVDINDHAPHFNQTVYTAAVREGSLQGVPFTRVYALDQDDPNTPNAQLVYSLVSQIPDKDRIPLFQIDPNTGEISTTREGENLLKARESIPYRRGETLGIDVLKEKFQDYCPVLTIPLEDNPFFTCVERAEMRRQNVNPLQDPDYTLIVRVQDLGGASETALSGSTKVHIVVDPNLWINPGPVTIMENLQETYPLLIAEVQSNQPEAVYRLLQKERELKFPFQISVDGKIYLTEALDREEKDSYILVVLAQDEYEKQVDPPMEILVMVGDVNDNEPECESQQTVFEIQEDEMAGSPVGTLVAHDMDQEGTLNAQLTFVMASQQPAAAAPAFAIDATSGLIQTLRILQRKENKMYNLSVKVSDSDFSTVCDVIVKVIDVNNQLPLFEKNDYGEHTVGEDTPIGHTLLSIRATDDDEQDSGSSFINFIISSGNEEEAFTVETDGSGVGHLVIAKPLDFESFPTYRLQIDARNPEPLMKGLEYGSGSTAFISISVTDVDEAPQFSQEVLYVAVPEDTTKGDLLVTVKAKDPEAKEIRFKMEGDDQGWLEINDVTGEVRSKARLDREMVEVLELTVTAFEKENPEKSSDLALTVRIMDVNDNVPKLKEKSAFMCLKKPQPIIIEAQDQDSDPFAGPFTFALSYGGGKRSPNWDLKAIDGTRAKLSLRKTLQDERTFTLPIVIKDNAGMGVTQGFEVKVCNCTVMGHCYVAAAERSFRYGVGPTVGILAGTMGVAVLFFVVAVKCSNSGKKTAVADDDRNAVM